ncbi:Chitin synthase, putative, partial [Perkinsus marinus ATCC 50983]
IDGRFNNLVALQRMGIYLDLEEMYRENGLMDIHGRIQPIDRYNIDSIDDKKASREQPRFTVDNGQTVYAVDIVTSVTVEFGEKNPIEFLVCADLHLFENVINYENYPPLQMMFALKEFNAGKLDTHLWFFEGFAHHMLVSGAGVEPGWLLTLNSGTRPEETSIVKLINAMDKDRNVAGCCGEITVDKALAPRNVFYNWYVASQDFEYKVGNCLDKAFESVCGYISVLPGAFSAYRWSALSPPELGPTSDKRPIVPYFKSVTHGGVINPFYGNMYLAEDRILALELVCSRTAANTLKYVKNSVAVTDVPDSCATLTKQRRRWMNGSFFAQIFALWQGLLLFRIFTTRHSWYRKLILMNELLFFALNTILTWFLVGIFYLTFTILWNSFLINGGSLRFEGADAVYIVIQFIYLILMFTTFLLAMGTQPDSPRRSLRALYKLISLVFGVFMLATFAVAVYNVVVSTRIVLMAIGLAAVLSYILVAVLHGEGVHVLLTYLQYTFMSPTYINIFQTFAFCNTHDLSWGTKGLDSNDVSQKDVQAKRNEFRTYLVLCWAITNLALIYGITSPTDGTSGSATVLAISADGFLYFVLGTVVFFNGVKSLGSLLFLVQYWFGRCCCCFSCGGGPSAESTADENVKNEWKAYRQNEKIASGGGGSERSSDWRQGTPHDPKRGKPNTAAAVTPGPAVSDRV